MKPFIGIIFLLGLMGVGAAQSDEFQLRFSTDIINAATPEDNGVESSPVAQPEAGANEALPPASEIETPAAAPTARPAPVYSNDGGVEGSRSESGPLRLPAENVQTETLNHGFMPLQTVTTVPSFTQNPWAKKPGSDATFPPYARRQPGESGVPFNQLRDQLRNLVGEDVYAQMVWTYLDAKRVDNWIYATVGQLDLFSNQTLFVGLNDRIRAGFTTGRMDGVRDNFGDWQNNLQSLQNNDAKSMVEQEALQANFEDQSRFFAYLKYLTPMNLIYLMLIVMGLIYGGKLFKFLISQR